MQRKTLTLLATFALATATATHAAEPVVYGPDGAPTVVQRKLFTMTGRWELGVGFSTAFNGPLVNHYGGRIGLTYHPNEWFDFGGEVVGNYTALSGLADQVREHLPLRATSDTHRPNTGDELANVAQLRASGVALARLAPIYGKFNLAAEVKIHFQAYGLLGAGAALFHHESVNLCGTAGQTACTGPFLTSDAVRPTGVVGAGLRFYFNDRFSINTEIRAWLFPDSYLAGADYTNPASGTDKSYLGVLMTFGLGFSTLF